jgi:subtilisin family serine protease
MRRHAGSVLGVLGLSVIVIGNVWADPPAGEELPPAGTRAPGRYIVVLRDEAPDVDRVAAELARRAGGAVGHVMRDALKAFVVQLPNAAAAAQLKDARVAFIEQDIVVQAFDHAASEIPTGINRINAELNPTTAAAVSWGAAVIDTGIQLTHPDLNVAGNVTFVRGTKSGNDDNGHGTHVAGTIGAKDNGSGVVGVIPGVKLYAVKVLNKNGSGWLSDVVRGIDWVTKNAAKIAVANMSLGAGPYATADDGNCGNTVGDSMHKAICGSVAKGVVYVVAAGNDGADAKDYRPASYDEVLTISALADSDGQPNGAGVATSYGPDDTLATFSNFGPDIDAIAPGVRINSTWIGSSYNGRPSGTSMASPHAAGTVALWIARNGRPATGNAKDPAVRAILAQSAEAVGAFAGDPDGIAEPLINADTLPTGGTGSSVCCPAP